MNNRPAQPTPDDQDLQATIPERRAAADAQDLKATIPAQGPAADASEASTIMPTAKSAPVPTPAAHDPDLQATVVSQRPAADAHDLEATVPAKGWDGAATLPAAAPAPGSGPSSDATLPMQFNRTQTVAGDAATLAPATVDPDATMVDRTQAAKASAARNQLAGNEAATLPATSAGTSPGPVGTGSFTANDAATQIGTSASGSGSAAASRSQAATGSFSQTGTQNFSQSFSRTGTRLGRTRVNGKLQLTDQQLDERLQMSRTSVLTDMAAARGEQAVPKGLQKLVTDQGTDARYHISRPLAAGGMGAVLHIEDNDFRRGAAMKVIHGKFANDPQALERFLAEAQVTAQLEHPNIVPIHDMGVMPDGSLYFTMKLIEGMSLGDVVKNQRIFRGLITREDYLADKERKESQKPAETRKSKEKIAADYDEDFAKGDELAKRFTVSETLLMFLKVLDGVGFAHSRGVVHRDIKPDNIMLGAHGEVLVVDWGIAKVLKKADRDNEFVRRIEKEVVSLRDQDAISATMTGSAMGTLFYMPPEQARGELDQIDGRSDIYALGATLYELLCLKRCLDVKSLPEALAAITTGDWIPLDRQAPELDKDLVAIVHRSMALDPARRYSDCPAFAEDIRRHLAGQAVLARRRNLIERVGAWVAAHKRQVQMGAAGVVLVGAAVSGTIWLSNRQRDQAFDSKLAEAGVKFDSAKQADDLAGMRIALEILATAKGIKPNDLRIPELNATFKQAIAEKEAALKLVAEQKVKLDIAHNQFEEGTKLASEQRYTEADAAFSAALKSDPGNAEYDKAREKVRILLRNKQLEDQKNQALNLRKKGDEALDKAAKLDPADAQVVELLDLVKKNYDPLEALPAIDGTQFQVQRFTTLRNAAEQARERKRLAADAVPLKAAVRTQITAKQFDAAHASLEQARGKTPGDKDLDTLLAELLTVESKAAEEQRTKEAIKLRDQALQSATGADAAGKYDDALSSIALALTHVPNDDAALKLRDQVEVHRQAAAKAARLQQAVAAADVALAKVRTSQQAADTEYRKALDAQAQVAQLERELGRSPIAKKQPLFAEVAAVKTARVAFEQNWSDAESAATGALAGFAEFPVDPKTVELRKTLCQLYVTRLQDARRTHAASSITTFTNLIRRSDPDGSFKRVLDNVGQLTLTGTPAAPVSARLLVEGPDTRLVPSGAAQTLEPGKTLDLPAGGWELRSGDQLISVVIEGGANRTVAWPANLPVIPGVPLSYVPANGAQKAFMLGTTEVTLGQYVAFLRSPQQFATLVKQVKEAVEANHYQPLDHVPSDPNGQGPQFVSLKIDPDDNTKLARIEPSMDPELPMGKVSRLDAEAYCAWLSTSTGLKVRLPKAREWQFAADGADDRRTYPWGPFFVPQFTSSALSVGADQKAVKVKSFPTDIGPFGNYDLAGNRREWLGDSEADGLLAGGANGGLIAGGSYSSDNPLTFTTTYTESVEPGAMYEPIGFRILVELP